MKGRASRAVYMRLQPSLLSPPSDPEEREKKKGSKKKREQKKLHPYLNQTSLDSESLEETSVWLYMVHLRRSGAPASRGASLLRALRFLHHVMGFNLDSMLRSRRVGGIAEQMSVGVEWLIGKLRR